MKTHYETKITTIRQIGPKARSVLVGGGMFVVSLLLFHGQAMAGFSGDHGDGYNHMMGWGDGGSMMLFGPVMMIGLVVVIILVVVSLMQRKPNSDTDTGQAASGALALLNERYAKGEIDHEEYEERKRRIQA